MRSLLCVLLALLPLACAHLSPEERARQQRCYAIELIPTGVTPTRPYRVLGPVSVDSDGNPAHRDRTLRERACQMQADAVMDVHDEAPSFTPAFHNPEGHPELVTGLGTAIVYTDVTAPVTSQPVISQPVTSQPVEAQPAEPAQPAPVEPQPSPSP